MKCDRNQLILYAVTDRAWLHGATLAEQVEQAILGGASCIQLREKDLEFEAFLAEARELKALCSRYGVPLIINDNVDIALLADADGVHVGQSDLEAGLARKRLGPNKIIGVSSHSVEEALQAQKNGADYLGAGAVFSTTSKNNVTRLPLETLKAICEAVEIPVVAIGGIGQQNIEKLAGTGIAGVAVIGAVFAQENIREAAAAMRSLSETVRRKPE